jgi:hypothetical protein
LPQLRPDRPRLQLRLVFGQVDRGQRQRLGELGPGFWRPAVALIGVPILAVAS